MDKEWVMLANASRARIYARDPEQGRLSELDDFVQPQARQMDRELSNARAGHVEKGHGASGRGSTQLEPRTGAHDKAHEQFARQLAEHIDSALQDKRCGSWVLIASNPFLGHVNAHLSQRAEKALRAKVVSDLSSFSGPELERRVSEALQAPR